MNNETYTLFTKAVEFRQKSKLIQFVQNTNKFVVHNIFKLLIKNFDLPVFPTYTDVFFNEKMRIVLPESVSMKIYRYGYYEEGLTAFFIKYLKPNMTFLDIGTHFGYFTLLASHLVQENGQVHSFEPTSATFGILKENTKNKKNITVNNLAVDKESGVLELNDYGIKHSAHNTIYTPRFSDKSKVNTKNAIKYKVDKISVDEYVSKNHIQVDFVKIDAESAEYRILQGMLSTIQQFKPIITLEVGDYISNSEVPQSKELIMFLLNQGYRAFEYDKGNIKPHKLKEVDSYQYDNIFFIHQDKLSC